ncbi:MAG: phage tail tape measure protein [Phyllobacteriaceae bacterium]|nr:phage tail tape measure protein [Phyllobacteriaceae bacterium]
MAASDDLSQLDTTTETLSERLSSLDDLSKSVGSSLSSAFKGAIVQGKSFDAVLRGLAERLSGKWLEAALTPLTSALGSSATGLFSSLSGLLGFAHGGVFSAGRALPFATGGVLAGGRVTPFADGGVVASPTYFPMRGSTGLMGEAGAEAIMPLTRGPDGRLGVAAQGGGGATNVVFNVTTPDAASFRRSQTQMTSMLARAVGRGRRGL